MRNMLRQTIHLLNLWITLSLEPSLPVFPRLLAPLSFHSISDDSVENLWIVGSRAGRNYTDVTTTPCGPLRMSDPPGRLGVPEVIYGKSPSDQLTLI